MATTDNEEQENKKTVIKETGDPTNNETSGETSSVASFDKSSATKKPDRKNKPLGASHEPGTTPGRDF